MRAKGLGLACVVLVGCSGGTGGTTTPGPGGAFPDAAHPGAPAWSARTVVGAQVWELTGLVTGDLDGDGTDDLVFSDVRGVGWHRFDGSFAPAAQRLDLPRTDGFAAGDVDLDGDLDALVVREDCVGFAPQVGGVFGAVQRVAVEPELGFHGIGSIDGLPGDDLVYGSDRFVKWAPGVGGVGVGAGGSLGELPGFIDHLLVVDVDGDGLSDLVASHEQSQSLSVWLNDASGQITGVVSLGLAAPPIASRAADLDGDGQLDLLVATVHQNNDTYFTADSAVWLLAGLGNGAFDTPVALVEEEGYLSGVPLVHDIDGDGAVDLVGTSGDLWLGPDFTPALERDSWSGYHGFGRLDADGDGHDEVVVGASESHRLQWADLQGGLSVNGIGEDVHLHPEHVVLQDVDDDGHLDVVSFGSRGQQLGLGDGAGGFTPSALGLVRQNGDVYGDMVFGDLDGDGASELVVGEDGFVALYGGGAGSYGPDPIQTVAVPGTAWLTELADVDGDGDLDLVVLSGDINGTELGWYANGAGTLSTDPVERWLFDESRLAVTVGDVDGDGAVDLVWTGEETVGWALGSGGGAFDPVVTVGGGPMRPAVIDLADLDGDGDLDLLVGTYDGLDRHLWTASGFGPSTRLHHEPVDAMAAGDLDGSGAIGLVLRGDDSLRVGALCGDVFEPSTRLADGGGGTHQDLQLGDVDGDGDLDAIYTSAHGALWRENPGTTLGCTAVPEPICPGMIDPP